MRQNEKNHTKNHQCKQGYMFNVTCFNKDSAYEVVNYVPKFMLQPFPVISLLKSSSLDE